ncbi:YebC/PmpR family DNA-binding transcriptional regulator [bacterium]|nr:YebC/PmpR family DNA-binding transcriptional regulator [bacterium]
MSGHSKWHNIRVKKMKMDQVRGRLFSKLSREIMVAARLGGIDPEVNPRLRLAISKAKEAGMPSENIERLLKRASGEAEDVHYEEVIYEGYGPAGVALMMEVLTDNKNRAAQEIRAILSRNGGTLAEAGSCSWLFERKGLLLVPKENAEEDQVLAVAIEAGAEDVKVDDPENYEVITAPEDLEDVKKAFEQAGIKIASADLTMIPKTTVRVEGKDAIAVLKLMELLEEQDDVQRVYANFDIPDEIMSAASQ